MPVDLNLPVPGQSPNWGQQLNDEIEKLNQSMNQGVYYAQEYGVIGSGTSDDTATMQNLIDLVPDGATIRGDVDAVYRSAGWTVVNKSLNLDFSQSTLVQTEKAPIIEAIGVWTGISNVSGLVNTNTVSTSGAGLFSAGDLVKVYARDVLPDARFYEGGGGARSGEFTVVTATTADTVTVYPRLLDSYTNTVRIAKMSDAKVTVKVREAYSVATKTENFTVPSMFRFIGLKYPEFSGYVSRGNGTAVGTRSCYGEQVKLTVKDLPFGDGYGVGCAGSAHGQYEVHALRTRHAWTDGPAVNNPSGAALEDPSSFGRAERATITGTALSNRATAWDTHHGGRNHTFVNCITKGQGNNDALFNVRGYGHQYIGCIAESSTYGFTFYTEEEESWATTYGHQLSNCVVKDAKSPLHFDIKATPNQPGGLGEMVATINGGSFESRFGGFVVGDRARVRFNNPSFISFATNITSPPAPLFHAYGTSALIGNVNVNLPNWSTGTIESFVTARYDNARVDLDIEALIPEYSKIGTPVLSIFRNNARGETRYKFNTSTSFSTALLNAPDRTVPLGDMRVTFRSRLHNEGAITGDRFSSAWYDTTPVAGQDIDFQNAGDKDVEIDLRHTLPVTVKGVAYARHPFQRLTLFNKGDSNITIPDGGTNMSSYATPLTIPPRGSVYLQWDPADLVWRRG